MKRLENFWPTEPQTLLLQAAVAEKKTAEKAWREYCQKMDLQEIDPISGTFLPLIYDRFKDQPNHANSSELNTCKSVYRHVWSQNLLLFFQIKKTLEALQAAKISACLLKGAAMVAGYYKNPALRVMGDVDVLIPQQQVEKAIEVLSHLGWALAYPPSDLKNYLEHKVEILLVHPNGHQFDLHWYIFADSTFDLVLKNFSYRTSDLYFDPFHMTVRVLSPEDQLLHTLMHGLKYDPTPLIRWVLDASWMIQKTPDFDWAYFLKQIHYLNSDWKVKRAFEYLQEHHFAEIPEFVMSALSLHPPTRRQLKDFKLFSQPKKGLLYPIRRAWYLNKRSSVRQNFFILLVTLPFSLKRNTCSSSWSEAFGFIWKKWRDQIQQTA